MLTTAFVLMAAAAAPVEKLVWNDDGELTVPPSDARVYRFAARSLLGLGTGFVGGATAEYWVLDHVGVGIHGAAYAGGGWGSSWTGLGAGPVLSLRTSATGSYVLLEASAGPGEWSRRDSGEFCLDWDGNEECEPPTYSGGWDVYLGGGLGWIFHPGDVGIELGPMLRVDAAGNSGVITITFALGYAT